MSQKILFLFETLKDAFAEELAEALESLGLEVTRLSPEYELRKNTQKIRDERPHYAVLPGCLANDRVADSFFGTELASFLPLHEFNVGLLYPKGFELPQQTNERVEFFSGDRDATEIAALIFGGMPTLIS